MCQPRAPCSPMSRHLWRLSIAAGAASVTGHAENASHPVWVQGVSTDGSLHEHGAPDRVAVTDAAVGDGAVGDLGPDPLDPPVPGTDPGVPLVVTLAVERERVHVDTGEVAAARAVAHCLLVT